MICSIFSHSAGLFWSFYFFDGVLWGTKLLKFWQNPICRFLLLSLDFQCSLIFSETWVRLIYGNSICYVYNHITEAFITLFAKWLCLLLPEAFIDRSFLSNSLPLINLLPKTDLSLSLFSFHLPCALCYHKTCCICGIIYLAATLYH